jgi:phosphatidylserine/phosphatidylglycerophosphate/cardiolipin synthase-like enzyme
MRNAITWLAYSRRPVTIRIMIGSHPPGGADPRALLEDLIRDAAGSPGSRIQLYVGAIRSCNGEASCGALSWNHAKIVVADGRRALVGGHNQWTADYLAEAPAHDLSMEVEGPAAAAAARFAGALWDFVCRQPADDGANQSVLFAAGQHLMKACLASMPLPPAAKAPVKRVGNVRILAVGRLGAGVTQDFADQSLVVRDLFLGAARQSIRMVQQDVAFSFSGVPLGDVWPDKDLADIVDLVTKRGGDAYLVLSNLDAAGPVGSYSNGVTLAEVAAHIMRIAKTRSGLQDTELVPLLCGHLHLAPLRFGPDDTWPDAKPIGVHAKFWMIDDRAFYIGSENLYPVALQEFGYIVEDKAATVAARAKYWDNVWQWSQRAAVSGNEARNCIFMPPEGAPHT